MLNGFINLYKTADISSNRALSILKRTLKQNNIVTKVGHFGTLDPMAEGVLPVALGRATRLFDYSLDKVKTYTARFRFGIETDTLDRTGKVVSTGRSDVTIEEINAVIPQLVGTIEQIPPQYSAKTVNGVRAYKMARKGQVLDLPPKTVEIYSIDFVQKIEENDGYSCEFNISCGGGTYIRSIVRDMAALLNTVGIMTSLIRTSSGIFTIDNAVSFEDLENNIENCILPLDIFLEKFPKIYLTDEQNKLLKNGITLRFSLLNVECGDNAEKNTYFAVYQPEGSLLGIGTELPDDAFGLKTWLL